MLQYVHLMPSSYVLGEMFSLVEGQLMYGFSTLRNCRVVVGKKQSKPINLVASLAVRGIGCDLKKWLRHRKPGYIIYTTVLSLNTNKRMQVVQQWKENYITIVPWQSDSIKTKNWKGAIVLTVQFRFEQSETKIYNWYYR